MEHAQITMPKAQFWSPKPDITAYELAFALPVVVLIGLRPLSFNSEEAVKALPPEVARHFSDQRPSI